MRYRLSVLFDILYAIISLMTTAYDMGSNVWGVNVHPHNPTTSGSLVLIEWQSQTREQEDTIVLDNARRRVGPLIHAQPATSAHPGALKREVNWKES